MPTNHKSMSMAPYMTYGKKTISFVLNENKAPQKGLKTNEGQEYEDTLCITEENAFSNEINPIKLADIGWCSDYKLSKMLALQIQNVMEGVLDPESVFGSPSSMSLIDECFLWFTKSALMKSKNFKDFPLANLGPCLIGILGL